LAARRAGLATTDDRPRISPRQIARCGRCSPGMRCVQIVGRTVRERTMPAMPSHRVDVRQIWGLYESASTRSQTAATQRDRHTHGASTDSR
jgi:hypothetical protein